MKGQKYGGRVKGTPNRVTAFTKTVINNIVSDYESSGQMKEDIQALTEKDRLHVMLKLMEFVCPKPQAIDLNMAESSRSAFLDRLTSLAEEGE